MSTIFSERKWRAYLGEMRQEYIDQVASSDKRMMQGHHAFDNLFGKHWRIVIPSSMKWNDFSHTYLATMGYAWLSDMKSFIEDRYMGGNVAKLDIDNKLVKVKKKGVNPKNNMPFEQVVDMRINKFFAMAASEYEKKAQQIEKETEANPPTNNQQLKNRKELAEDARAFVYGCEYHSKRWEKRAHLIQNAIIIISRHPVDVLRMSDVGNGTHFRSCHSQGGDYFECAIEEAQGHGFVAYLVDKKEFDKIKDKIDSYQEIFSDTQRDVPGISAISRARAREFYSKKDNYSIALPEEKMYGTKIDSFKRDFDSWLHSVQDPQLPKNLNPNDFELLGGEYSDARTNNAEVGLLKLFQDYFPDRRYRNNDEYINDFGDDRNIRMLQDEAYAIEKKYLLDSKEMEEIRPLRILESVQNISKYRAIDKRKRKTVVFAMPLYRISTKLFVEYCKNNNMRMPNVGGFLSFGDKSFGDRFDARVMYYTANPIIELQFLSPRTCPKTSEHDVGTAFNMEEARCILSEFEKNLQELQQLGDGNIVAGIFKALLNGSK